MSVLLVSDLDGVSAPRKPRLFVMSKKHTPAPGVSDTSNEKITSIFVVTADSFQAPWLFFPLCRTAEQVGKKAQRLPPLTLVGNSNHISPSPCVGSITPGPPFNHHRTPRKLLCSQSMFQPLKACLAHSRKSLVSNRPLMVYV